MDHPLDDARLKIAAAKKEFDSLRAEIIEFDKAHPYVVRISVDPETGDELFQSDEPPTFPGSWAATVGHIAHDCRSALDYLINILLRETGGEPNRYTAFPISISEDDYLRPLRGGITYRDRCLGTLPDPIKEKVDKLQPYLRGDLAYADALIVLRHLTDRDKHRHPHTAYAWINTPSKAFTFPTTAEMKNIEIRLPREGGLKVKADFKGGRRMPPAVVLYPDVKMQRPPGAEVVFGRDDPSKVHGLDDIRGLILYVESIIESFAGDVQP